MAIRYPGNKFVFNELGKIYDVPTNLESLISVNVLGYEVNPPRIDEGYLILNK